jgi:hypothetical protein
VDLSAAVLTARRDVVDDNALHERALKPDQLPIELRYHVAEKNVVPVYSHVEVWVVILEEKCCAGKKTLAGWEYHL